MLHFDPETPARQIYKINYYVSQIPFLKKVLNEKETQKPIIDLVDLILAITKSEGEPPRIYRRHKTVRGLCYGKAQQVFEGSPGTGGTVGIRA